MSAANTKREREKVQELARDYLKKGFKVLVNPSSDRLPPFLRKLDFSPDLIATSKAKNYVIEVTSKDSAQHLKALGPMVDAINKAKRWDFLLVMTNPRRSAIPKISPLELYDLQTPLQNVRSLAAISADSGRRYDQAVVLLAWSVIEAALRMYLYSHRPEPPARVPASIVRDAVMRGFLNREEGKFLTRIAAARNAIAHGALTENLPPDTVDRVVKLSTSLAKRTG